MADRRDDLGFIRSLLAQILKYFRENTAFHRLMLYAGLEGHTLRSMFHERMGSSMLEFIRSYVVLRQREGAFRKGDPDAQMMLLASPALQYASGKHIFGMKTISRPEKEIVDEFAKLLLAALSASPKSSKKTSKRKA